MARSIAADSSEAWRAVIIFKREDGTLEYVYEGVYNSKSAAKGRVTYWINRQAYRDRLGVSGTSRLYDGWVEQADITWTGRIEQAGITWDKVKD